MVATVDQLIGLIDVDQGRSGVGGAWLILMTISGRSSGRANLLPVTQCSNSNSDNHSETAVELQEVTKAEPFKYIKS